MAGLSPEELKDKTIRFFDRYEKEIEEIKELLEIKLKQLALAYTIEKNLPADAVTIKARVKTLYSFLRKLALNNWPQFDYPTEVINDLIGARIICWFNDDCYGIKKFIDQWSQIKIIKSETEDYIKKPKKSGYRSIHLIVYVPNDVVKSSRVKVKLAPIKIKAEIQIRTKLQDSWAEITHELHRKKIYADIKEKGQMLFLAQMAKRIEKEDEALMKLKKVYRGFKNSK